MPNNPIKKRRARGQQITTTRPASGDGTQGRGEKMRRVRAQGRPIGETVRIWQRFMAKNGLLPMALSCREVTARMAQYWNKIFKGLRSSDSMHPLTLLLTHDEKAYIKGRKFRLPELEEL